MQNRSSITLGALLLLALHSPSAVSAEPLVGDTSQCFPRCSGGSVCRAQRCVSSCNPACGDGEVCKGDGVCASACSPACPADQRCGEDTLCHQVIPIPTTPAEREINLVKRLEAETASIPQLEPPKLGPPNRIWLELMSYVTTADVGGVDWGTIVGFSPVLRARFTLAKYLLIHANLPLAAASIGALPGSTGSSTQFRFANPSVSLSGLIPIDRRTWLALGVGFAAPVASVPVGPNDVNFGANQYAYLLASAMRGQWEPWAYAVDTAGLYLPLELDWGTERLRFSLEAIPHYSIPVNGRTTGAGGVLVGGRAQLYTAGVLSLGGRLRAAFDLTSGVNDRCQVSVEPFIEVVAARHLLVGLGFVWNLDNPFGMSSNFFVWGARVSLGVQF